MQNCAYAFGKLDERSDPVMLNVVMMLLGGRSEGYTLSKGSQRPHQTAQYQTARSEPKKIVAYASGTLDEFSEPVVLNIVVVVLPEAKGETPAASKAQARTHSIHQKGQKGVGLASGPTMFSV